MEIEVSKKVDIQLGQFVLIQDEEEVKLGKIEDLDNDAEWFDCFLYYKPEQTAQGRQSHNGANEIFKTQQWQRFKHNQIVAIVRVMKLQQYQKFKNEDLVFVHRQDYDVNTKVFTTQLQKCICEKYPNPDDILVICEFCLKAFCANCLKINLKGMKFFTCDQCRNTIPDRVIFEKFDQLLHQKPELKKTVSSKSNQVSQTAQQTEPIILQDENEEDNDEMDLSKRGPKIDLEKLAKKIKQNDKTPATIIQKPQSTKELPQIHNISTDQTVNIQLDKQNSHKLKQPLKNISQDQLDKINTFIKQYKLQETAGPVMTKRRLEVREKFLQILFYGVEELRDLQKSDPYQIKQSEFVIISQEDSLLFNYLKKLVLEIEISLHIKFNCHQRYDKLDPAYIDRCKIVYCHLKDDKNLELRRKVITKEFTANDLCTKEERELFNPEKKRETMEMTKLNFELDKKVDVDKTQIQVEEEPEVTELNKSKHSSYTDQNINKQLIQTDVYKSLQEFLPKQQYARILNRLQNELKNETSLELVNNLKMIHNVK